MICLLRDLSFFSVCILRWDSQPFLLFAEPLNSIIFALYREVSLILVCLKRQFVCVSTSSSTKTTRNYTDTSLRTWIIITGETEQLRTFIMTRCFREETSFLSQDSRFQSFWTLVVMGSSIPQFSSTTIIRRVSNECWMMLFLRLSL